MNEAAWDPPLYLHSTGEAALPRPIGSPYHSFIMKKSRARQGKLHDTQSSPDFRNLRIDKVGVKGLRYPIVVRDRSRATQNTVATVALAVDLPHQFKGTHMSRFLEVLQDHGGLIHVQSIPKSSGPCRTSSTPNPPTSSWSSPTLSKRRRPSAVPPAWSITKPALTPSSMGTI